jgi:hypothetical protein
MLSLNLFFIVLDYISFKGLTKPGSQVLIATNFVERSLIFLEDFCMELDSSQLSGA